MPPSVDDFQTQKLQSKNGKEFEAGKLILKPAGAATVQVNWSVDNQWHTTSSEVQDATGITSYIVGDSSSPFADYYIQINTNWEGNNGFTDSGNPQDTYWLSVNDTSDSHIVRYSPDGNNNNRGTISSVTYTP